MVRGVLVTVWKSIKPSQQNPRVGDGGGEAGRQTDRYVRLTSLGAGEEAVRKQKGSLEIVGFSYPHLVTNTRKHKATTSEVEKSRLPMKEGKRGTDSNIMTSVKYKKKETSNRQSFK